MLTDIFWVVLRSVAIPLVAFLILKETFLGEAGALLAIGIGLTVVTAISLLWNAIKIVGNTLLLRGEQVVILLVKVVIQLVAVAFIWFHYFGEYASFL